MDEILKKLLKSELLSEETKAEISEQWSTTVETFKTQVREEVSMEVRSELAEQWISERDELINKIDQFFTEALENEITELKDDISRFRDIEAEYAERIVENKHEMAVQLDEELVNLVDKIDAFFEARLNLELEELKEDLEVAKQNEFGKRIFEAFATTYNKAYVDEDSIQTKLAITEAKLEDAEHQLATLEQQKELMIRESKMDQVLANLSGKKREHMAMVLRNVETERLEESYKYFIGRVLKEDNKTVLESEQQNKTTLVTGVKLNEQLSPSKTNGNDLANLKRLAGIK